LTIAGGVCASDDLTTVMGQVAYTKTFAAWAVGNGNGALDTGSVAASTWYHVFTIERTDTYVVDFLFSTSATAPTLPTSYTKQRRIGSIKTDGSKNIVSFVQDGDTFQWSTNSADVAAANPGTSAVTRTMNTPLGVRVEGIFTIGAVANGTNIGIYLSDLSVTDEAPVAASPIYSGQIVQAAPPSQYALGNVRVFTNTSSQIRSRLGASGADLTLYISTRGWVDRRSRDA
jgi:hypothetical protein